MAILVGARGGIVRTCLRLMRIVPAAAIMMIFGSCGDRCRKYRETNQDRHQTSFGFHCRYLLPHRESIKDAIDLTSQTPCIARVFTIGITKSTDSRYTNSDSGNEKRQRREQVNARSGKDGRET